MGYSFSHLSHVTEGQGPLVAETILSLRYAELQTSSFWGVARGSLSGTVVPIPAPWESQIVLRSLWAKLLTEAIGVHALQFIGDAALVPIYELDDAVAGGRLQRAGGVFAAAAAGGKCALGAVAGAIPGLDLV